MDPRMRGDDIVEVGRMVVLSLVFCDTITIVTQLWRDSVNLFHCHAFRPPLVFRLMICRVKGEVRAR